MFCNLVNKLCSSGVTFKTKVALKLENIGQEMSTTQKK